MRSGVCTQYTDVLFNVYLLILGIYRRKLSILPNRANIIYIYMSVCLSLSFCLNAFAQFLRYRAETSQVRQWLSVTGRGAVDDFMIPPVGLGIKG